MGAAAEALDFMDTLQSPLVQTGVRIRLGRNLTLGQMAPVVAAFREALFGTTALEIEIDAQQNERVSEGARTLLLEFVDKAQREGIDVRFIGRSSSPNRLALLR